MFTEALADNAQIGPQVDLPNMEFSQGTHTLHRERAWRQPERDISITSEDIAMSRWVDPRNTFRREDAFTPRDQYFIGVALKSTRVKLTRARQMVFDGIMPAGTLYVGTPSMELSAQFDAPYDFLHLHVSARYFRSADQGQHRHELNDYVLLRDPFAAQLAKALVEHDDTIDAAFADSIGRTLAMHVARLELPRVKLNALSKWRLRRVTDYVSANFDRCISLSDLADVAGLSRMHFAAQFRAATGYRPREYLLQQRIEQAKFVLASTETSLAEVALAVGFCTQAHFSTVFKRIAGETPARWRCAIRNETPPSAPRNAICNTKTGASER
jgi:AraC family transcriptional regulator